MLNDAMWTREFYIMHQGMIYLGTMVNDAMCGLGNSFLCIKE